MDVKEVRLQSINSKINHILDKLTQLYQENESLKSELSQVQEKAKAYQDQVSELKEELVSTKLVAGPAETGEKAELKKKLNGYIKEIDRCITLLNN